MSLFKALPALQEAIVFVGDSLTQRNQWQEFFPYRTVLNRGIDSDRSLGVLRRLDDIISLTPTMIFLMVGINDLNDKRDMDSILANYEAIVNRIKSGLPYTKLYIQGLLPVNNSVFSHPVNNDDVKSLNIMLAHLAEKHTVKFIDIYPHVLKKNELNAEYTIDGCHLSGQGYLAWVELIKPFVAEQA